MWVLNDRGGGLSRSTATRCRRGATGFGKGEATNQNDVAIVVLKAFFLWAECRPRFFIRRGFGTDLWGPFRHYHFFLFERVRGRSSAPCTTLHARGVGGGGFFPSWRLRRKGRPGSSGGRPDCRVPSCFFSTRAHWSFYVCRNCFRAHPIPSPNASIAAGVLGSVRSH